MAEARERISTRVYRDEPIPWDALPKTGLTPPRYREMRALAGHGVRFENDAKLFWEQGKFMENFEDDFDYPGGFTRYCPTYHSMTDAQLRGYFSWRAKARRGAIERTPAAFAFLYIYELLNQIGVRAPEEGFQKLRDFRAACGTSGEQIDLCFPAWMRDYVVYYDLDRSLLGDSAVSDFERAALTLLNHSSHGEDEVFAALNSLSAYDIAGSRLFGQYPADVKRVVCGTFARLSDHCAKGGRGGVCEKFLGAMYSYSHTMFQCAVFHDRLWRKDFVYEINEINRYRCENGRWSRERVFRHKEKLQETGVLLKTIDRLMRLRYGFKPPLKPLKLAQTYQAIIQKEIDACWEDRARAARPAVEIDVSKLRGIREAALETQNKLIVEDPEHPNAPSPSTPPNGSQGDTVPSRDFSARGQSPKVVALTAPERRFLACLLRGEPDRGPDAPMLSVLIDGINEKLFDTFGDTVIAFEGEKPTLIEDYGDELREIIGE